MALRAEKIAKQYLRHTGKGNCFHAVCETNMVLKEGTLSVLIGRSGSGKTTLLNMLSGLLQPTQGKVFMDDTDIYALNDEELATLRNRYFGVIPQGRAVIDTLTVLDNLLLPGRLYASKEENTLKERALSLLDTLDILPLANVYPDELSGGEVRRVSIARALLYRPTIILADEPTGDLDNANTKLVLDTLRETANEGASVFLVTHELLACDYADMVYHMDAGVLKDA